MYISALDYLAIWIPPLKSVLPTYQDMVRCFDFWATQLGIC